MGVKISELPEKSEAEAADLVPIVDVSAPGGLVSKRTTVAGLILQAISDWWAGTSDKSKLDRVDIAESKTLSVDNTISMSSSDGASVDFGAGGNVMYGNSTIDGGSY